MFLDKFAVFPRTYEPIIISKELLSMPCSSGDLSISYSNIFTFSLSEKYFFAGGKKYFLLSVNEYS